MRVLVRVSVSGGEIGRPSQPQGVKGEAGLAGSGSAAVE